MAELLRYTTFPIPRPGPIFEEIAPQLAAVRRLEVPGIIIPDVAPDTPAAMAILTPILAACGIEVRRTLLPVENPGGSRDQPLHIDSLPIDHQSTGMVVQHTRFGSADIVLSKLADPFCTELSRRNAHVPLENHTNADYALPPGTDELLDEGFVDPDVIRPEVYVGPIAAGGVIAFTFGGANPIAHRFRSTSPDRHVQGHLASFDRL